MRDELSDALKRYLGGWGHSSAAFQAFFPNTASSLTCLHMFYTIAPSLRYWHKAASEAVNMTLQHTRRIVKFLFCFLSLRSVLPATPRVAINAFGHPDNKVYGQPLPKLSNPLPLPPKMSTYPHGWFIPTAFGRCRENAVATVIHVHGNAGNMSAHWPPVSWLPER